MIGQSTKRVLRLGLITVVAEAPGPATALASGLRTELRTSATVDTGDIDRQNRMIGWNGNKGTAPADRHGISCIGAEEFQNAALVTKAPGVIWMGTRSRSRQSTASMSSFVWAAEMKARWMVICPRGGEARRQRPGVRVAIGSSNPWPDVDGRDATARAILVIALVPGKRVFAYAAPTDMRKLVKRHLSAGGVRAAYPHPGG